MTALLTLMCPSLRIRVNLDSTDHTTFFNSSRVQSVCSLENWSLFFLSALQICGFLKATELVSSSTLRFHCSVHLEIILPSLLNITMTSCVDLFAFDLTKHPNISKNIWSLRIMVHWYPSRFEWWIGQFVSQFQVFQLSSCFFCLLDANKQLMMQTYSIWHQRRGPPCYGSFQKCLYSNRILLIDFCIFTCCATKLKASSTLI